MNSSTKKWLFLKYSSAVVIPLMLWFIINLVSIYESDHADVVILLSSQPHKILFTLFLVFFFFFSSLTVSEIFEDYIKDEKIKNVANKAIYIFAIIMPLITIICLFNLKL
jgi:succinate dehydrogenase / fumarate reductase membrane anchor subunit